jgi:formate hydrogenlyase subunit 6/NADH:ubiquinone oxidoreductase subunit I
MAKKHNFKALLQEILIILSRSFAKSKSTNFRNVLQNVLTNQYMYEKFDKNGNVRIRFLENMKTNICCFILAYVFVGAMSIFYLIASVAKLSGQG